MQKKEEKPYGRGPRYNCPLPGEIPSPGFEDLQHKMTDTYLLAIDFSHYIQPLST